MPQTQIVFYQETAGKVPVLDWLKERRRIDQTAYTKCVAAIELLSEMGHELRRPLADYLRDGLYELRVRRGHVNYRIVYFFHGRNVAILIHALQKEDRIPNADFEHALRRRKAYEQNPTAHSYREEEA